ncbi:hypothetical protein ACFVUW_15025 [Streptomyces xiamenensis]
MESDQIASNISTGLHQRVAEALYVHRTELLFFADHGRRRNDGGAWCASS